MKRKGSAGSTIAMWIFFLTVIGILCAAMMLSSTGPCPGPAPVSNILAELRNCKAAAIMYFVDSTISPDVFPKPMPGVNNIEQLGRYLDNPERTIAGGYMLYVSGDAWWIGLQLKNPPVDDKSIREKLESRAAKVGLYGTSEPTVLPVSYDLAGLYKQEDAVVWMRAR